MSSDSAPHPVAPRANCQLAVVHSGLSANKVEPRPFCDLFLRSSEIASTSDSYSPLKEEDENKKIDSGKTNELLNYNII